MTPAVALAAPAAGAEEEARGLALAFFERLNRGDAPGALALIDAGATIEIVPAAVKGSAAGEGGAFLTALVTAFPDLYLQVRSLSGTADLAVAEIKMEGTQAADFLGILNQEKHLDVDQAWMVWAAGGKITGLRAYWCQNQLYRRLAVKRLDRIFILGVAMSGASAAQAVKGFFDAYRARDVEAMVSACSEGADFHYPPVELWGKQRVLRGDGKVGSVGKVLWTGLIQSFPDLTNEVTSLHADEDGHVAAEVTLRGTQARVWGTIDNKGKAFALRHLFLFRVQEDGLIDSVTAYWDSADLHRQLGRMEID